jgi:glycerophosphoryl diester phosphodiesterase
MIILAHRGFWLERHEQNTLTAFERAFEKGFGIETDLRDHNGNIVISHDLPIHTPINLENLLELHSKYDNKVLLALNIKADGLQKLTQAALSIHQTSRFFFFDMAVPDAVLYLRLGLPCFTRQSEYEAAPSFYPESKGIWIDEFNHHWVTNSLLLDHIQQCKQICLVSPELHGRPYETEWLQYREISRMLPHEAMMICTDHPDHANNFFNGA